MKQVEKQKIEDIRNIGKHKAKMESKTAFSKPESTVLTANYFKIFCHFRKSCHSFKTRDFIDVF